MVNICTHVSDFRVNFDMEVGVDVPVDIGVDVDVGVDVALTSTSTLALTVMSAPRRRRCVRRR